MIVYISFVVYASFTYSSTASTTCGSNEIYVECRQICPPQSCNISYTEYNCDPPPDCEPGCNCIDNYLRDGNNVCIKNDDCPPPPPACGENEVQSDCKQVCPPQTCDYDPTKFACKPGPCQPGCNCIDGYLRNSDGVCVSKTTCPKPLPECGENETPTVCKKRCSPQTCASQNTKVFCRPGPCRPGCNCNDGYVRNSDGKCILKELCPKDAKFGSEGDISKTSSFVSRSMASSSSYENSVGSSSFENYDSRNISKGSEGDSSATASSVSSSEASSSSYSNSFSSSNSSSSSLEYYDSSNQSKDSNKCRQNETHVFCNAGCPTNYCPVDDRRGTVACGMPNPCPPGCACEANYKRVSVDDDRCILASECPPVDCTRPHEVWYSCPPPCFSDSCRLIGVEIDCPRGSGPDCQPQCACEEGYYRNDDGDCVLQEDCATK